jgi:hypothetical protein
MKKNKDAEDKTKKDLSDRNASWDRREACKKISYQGEVEGHDIDTPVSYFMVKWQKLFSNDINYSKAKQ